MELMDSDERLVTRLLEVLPPLSEDSRIVVIGSNSLAIRIAEHLRDSLVIVLQSELAGRAAPANVEFLSCGLAGAQFLPESVFAVVALEQDEQDWQSESAVQTVAGWLQPGGIFYLDRKAQGLRRWWPSRLPGPGRDLIAMAESVGLQEDLVSAPRLRIWRKIRSRLTKFEERYGNLAG